MDEGDHEGYDWSRLLWCVAELPLSYCALTRPRSARRLVLRRRYDAVENRAKHESSTSLARQPSSSSAGTTYVPLVDLLGIRSADLSSFRVDAGSNPNTLTPSDAQKLMEFSPGSPIMASSPASKRASPLLAPSESFVSRTAGLLTRRPKSIARSISGSSAVVSWRSVFLDGSTDFPLILQTPTADSSSHSELLDWVNSNLPASTAKASDLGTSMRSGEILVRLAEKLSGDNSGMDDAAFAKYRPEIGRASCRERVS